MDQCNLVDMECSGDPFTWSNYRLGNTLIKDKLGHGLVNSDFMLVFPSAVLTHFPVVGSDHKPLLLNLEGTKLSFPRSFKFLSFWTEYKQFYTHLNNAWHYSDINTRAYVFNVKLSSLKFELISWHKRIIQNLKNQIVTADSRLS